VEILLAVLDDICGLPPSTSGVGGEPRGPEGRHFSWALHQNTPNPWSGGTEIRYDVASDTRVSIRIYSPTGRFIKSVVDRRMDPGQHSAVWDGKSASGNQVAAGIYFYKMEAGGFTATRKMLFMR
jgi:flagellar hook assembly protein FlgD